MPFGALTKKRIVPVVEIEPLKLVPAGREYWICDDEEESVKVGTVVANAEETINNVSKAANVAESSNLVFFMPVHQMLIEINCELNNSHAENDKRTFV